MGDKKKQHVAPKIFLPAILVATVTVVIKILVAGEPLSHVAANVLLFTPFHLKSPSLYTDPAKILPEGKHEHLSIIEIEAKDYSYEKLRVITDNFKQPAIVRGLFSDTTAVKRWAEPGYLSQKLAGFNVAVNTALNKNGLPVNKEHPDIEVIPFETVCNDLISNDESNLRFIFPPYGRKEINGSSILEFAEAAKDLVRNDLTGDLIKEEWASKAHSNLLGVQVLMGRGFNSSDAYKGLGWHSEPGNNWFIQVHGSKRWFFMDPKKSSLMLPTKKTGRLIVTSDMEKMDELHSRMPIQYADVRPGDMIYNPEWYWHRTLISPGLSISVPMREVYLLRLFERNSLYTTLMIFMLPFEHKNFVGNYLRRLLGFY